MIDDASEAALPPGASFHHLGYASRAIDVDARPFLALGYVFESDAFVDPIQGVRGRFLVGAGPRIELLENLPERNTLTPFLDAGIKLYHVAYEVDDLAAAMRGASTARARTLSQPAPAVAFGGRPIAFVMFRTGLIVELIARTATSDP